MAATDEKMLARQYIYRLNLNKLKGARPCCNQNYYQGHPKPTHSLRPIYQRSPKPTYRKSTDLIGGHLKPTYFCPLVFRGRKNSGEGDCRGRHPASIKLISLLITRPIALAPTSVKSPPLSLFRPYTSNSSHTHYTDD